MNDQDKSKEQLINELQELKLAHNSLKATFEANLLSHKIAEEALQDSEKRFRNVLQDIKTVAVQGYTPDGTTTYWNKASELLYGFTAQEALGSNILDLIVPFEMRDYVSNAIKSMAESGQPVPSSELLLKRKDGTLVPVFSHHTIVQVTGQLLELFCIDIDLTDSKQVEDKLKDSEQWYRNLFDQANEGLILLTMEGKIAELNKSFAQMHGYTVEEMKNMNIKDLDVLREDAFDGRDAVMQRIYNGEVVRFEVEHYHKNGHSFFMSNTASLITIAGQQYFLAFHQDITDRKQAENEILKISQHYKALIEKAPDGIALIDTEGNFKYISPAAKKMFGYDQTEGISGHPNEYTHPDDLQMVLSELGKIFEDPNYIPTLEYRFIDKLGHWHWVETTFSNLLANPCVESIVLNFRDITERKQNEEKLIKSQERYALVIDASEQGIWDWNVETNEIFYSEQWKKQIGYKDHELENEFSTWVEHLHPDEREYCQNAVYSYLNQPVEHFILDFRFRHKDGTYRWIHSKAASLKNTEGRVIRLFGTHTDISESKVSEAIFKDIIEKNPISIQILDKEGYQIQVNSAHTKLFGVKPPYDYSVFKDTQLLSLGFDNLFEQIKKGEVVYFPDSYYNVHDVDPSFPDSPAWVKALGFTLNDNNGNPSKIVLMHENITESKNAEALLNDIIENNPMSIQVVDINGHTIRCNPAFTELFGSAPPPEFSIFDDLRSKSAELGNLISRVKNGEMVHLPDLYFNAHDAVAEAPDIPLWIRALIFPLKDSAGKPKRFVFMHENITERKIAEQELIKAKEQAQESEVKYRQIFDNTFDIMAIYEVTEDRRYKVVTFNAAEEKLIGPVENYQNRYIDECIPPDLYEQFRRNYERCIEAEELIIYEEYISFGDIHKTFRTQLIPLKNSQGRIHRIIVISIDITENEFLQMQMIEQNNALRLLNIDLKHAKEKAEESDKLKSAFLANMSHEIRTPMNGILGFTELLSEPDLGNEKQQKYIDIIQKNGARLLNIINDIVSISKIESGIMNIHLTETNISNQLQFVYDSLKLDANNKKLNLSFTCALSEKQAIIKTDSEKLYGILSNLVKNAIKYTETGTIEFGYDIVETDNYPSLQFFVKDTGIGILKERQDAIFERFNQADIGDKMVRKGAGLGLSIAKAYVELLGGKIWVKSEVNVGSTFYFTLPYKKAE